MPFQVAENIQVTIRSAYLSEARWKARSGEKNQSGKYVTVIGDFCLLVADEAGNSDTWRGELSNRNGNGRRAHQEQTEITLEKLQAIGLNAQSLQSLIEQADENNRFPSLIGKQCTITTERREYKDKYGNKQEIVYIKYLNPTNPRMPKPIAREEFLRRVRESGLLN